jgi:hypothetical protein
MEWIELPGRMFSKEHSLPPIIRMYTSCRSFVLKFLSLSLESESSRAARIKTSSHSDYYEQWQRRILRFLMSSFLFY